jgi:pimeloyl-ACP methyl ester carboxylesterase
VEGCEAVGALIGAGCRNVAFEGCNHWLYLEAPDHFNELVASFVGEG